MTHSSTRLSHVFFGAGLTMVVALAPVLFIVLSGPSASAGETSKLGDSSSAPGLGGLQLAEHQSVVVLIAGVATAALLLAVHLSTRVERER